MLPIFTKAIQSQIPWSKIFYGIVAIALVGSIMFVGMQWQKANDSEIIIKQIVNAHNIELKKKDDQILELIEKLKAANDQNSDNARIIQKIQSNVNTLQNKYLLVMEKVDNAKLPLNEKGTLSEPIILIPGGVPTEARPSSDLH